MAGTPADELTGSRHNFTTPDSRGHAPKRTPVRGKRVLVTGSAGFIGRHLARELAMRGAKVQGLDREAQPGADWPSFSLDIMSGDLETLNLGRMDYVFHLAAVTGVVRASSDPVKTLHVNYDGTARILALAKILGAKRFCLLSSSEVYGESPLQPLTEDQPLRPRSAYAQAKVLAEALLERSVNDEFTAVVVRPFNVYGLGQNEEFVVPRFVSAALTGRPLCVAGDGTQVRTFTHITDFIQGTIAAMELSRKQFDIFNIAGSETMSIAQLADTINQAAGGFSERHHLSLDDFARPAAIEIHTRIASIEKAEKMLDYHPKVGLREGLAKVISDLRDGSAKDAA